MARIGICGPAYRSQSPNVDAETLMNLYCELDERQGKNAYSLYSSPGTKLFCTLADPPVRALITTQGTGAVARRTFAIGGSGFNEITAAGAVIPRGNPIVNDGSVVSNAPGPSQILFTSGGVPYVYDLNLNTVAPVNPAILAGVAQVGYSDGFFIALFQNSNKLAVSKTLDATMWDPTQVTNVSIFPDNILSLLVDHRELFMWGGSKSVVYYNSGNLFPFDPNPSGIIEQGIIAAASAVKADNSVFWLTGSERGAGIFYRTVGYTPQRISDHGVEYALSTYPTIADAVGYAFEDQGHTFIQWMFPTAQKTWVYDTATGFWHQRGYWNVAEAAFTAHKSWVHTYNFGLHLVGDPTSGKIYSQSINYLDDAGNPIRRERVAPHVSREREWVFYPAIQIDLETGLGPEPPLLSGGKYDSTRIQVPGNPGLLQGFAFTTAGASNLRAYTVALLLTNNNNVPISVNGICGASIQTVVVAAGATQQVVLNIAGDGVSHIQLLIETQNNGDLIDVTSINPVILDSGTNINIIPVGELQFVGADWTTFSLAAVITQQQPTPGSTPREPQLLLSWSDDGGHTYSNEYALNCGMAGQFKRRAIKRRLGKSRGRTFKIAMTDPVPWRIVDAYIPPAQERIAEQIRKVS